MQQYVYYLWLLNAYQPMQNILPAEGQVPLTDEMAGLAPLYSICQCLVTLRAAMKLVCISCRLLCVTYEALSIIPNTKHFWGENF